MKLRRRLCGVVVAWCLIGVSTSLAAPKSADARPKNTSGLAVIDRFVEHVGKADSVDAAAGKFIADQWRQRRDRDDADAFLAEALAVLSPKFKEALAAYEDGRLDAAAKAMAALAGDKELYLALNAAVFEARALVDAGQLELAQKRLTVLTKREADVRKHTLYGPDVRFLQGYCQLGNLQYKEATETLESFQKDYPHAPERLRATAKQILQELARRKAESLGDVVDLLAYAGRRLGHGASDKNVTDRQVRAVELLGKLIKKAEDKEKSKGQCSSCKGKGCKSCKGSGKAKGNQTPSSPAKKSTLADGKTRIGDLRARVARPGESWGKMPRADRERILQSVTKNFPSRYRDLVEQYYKQLAKEQ